MFTLFEMTIGNWTPSSRLLSETVSEWYVFFILAHQCCISFAVVMVITAIFLQETFKVAETDNSIMMRQHERHLEVHTKKMKDLFEYLDSDGSEGLDREEFAEICNNSTIKTWLGFMG